MDRKPGTRGGRSGVEHEETEFGRNSRVPPGNSSSGQPKANPKLKPPRNKRRARGQPQKIQQKSDFTAVHIDKFSLYCEYFLQIAQQVYKK
jgi:hypothetical protein